MFQRTVLPMSPAYASRTGEASLQMTEMPASFVHELLHLFGAEDLYQPEARRELAKELYPDEVMLQSHRALDEIQIGPHTEYLIGWSTEKPLPLPVE